MLQNSIKINVFHWRTMCKMLKIEFDVTSSMNVSQCVTLAVQTGMWCLLCALCSFSFLTQLHSISLLASGRVCSYFHLFFILWLDFFGIFKNILWVFSNKHYLTIISLLKLLNFRLVLSNCLCIETNHFLLLKFFLFLIGQKRISLK